MKRVCVSQTELRSTDCKNQVVTHCSTPPAALRCPLTESSLTCWNSSEHLSHVILTKVSSEVRIADAARVKNFTRPVTFALFPMVNSHPFALFVMVNSHPIALFWSTLTPLLFFSWSTLTLSLFLIVNSHPIALSLMFNSHPIALSLMVNSHPSLLFLMVNSHPIALFSWSTLTSALFLS